MEKCKKCQKEKCKKWKMEEIFEKKSQKCQNMSKM